MRLFGALFFVGAFFIGSFSVADAALLYMDPDTIEAHRGDTFTVNVRLDTDENECVNTVDAIIRYSPNIRAVDVSRGESILSVWVEPPVVNEAERTITFAGGIPGGYCGRIAGDPVLTNTIAKLVFTVPGLSIGASDPIAHITFDEATQVLLHDGFGTQAPLQVIDATAALAATPGGSITDNWNSAINQDNIAPAEFSITLTSDPYAFSGKHFIVFNTLDKQSGIDHYEVMEEPFEDFNLFNWGRVDAPWVETESPYVLKDQSLNSTIRVKAIDKAGNQTIAVLVPDEAMRSISNQRLIAILVLGGATLVIAGIIAYAFWRRRQEVETTRADESESHIE